MTATRRAALALMAALSALGACASDDDSARAVVGEAAPTFETFDLDATQVDASEQLRVQTMYQIGIRLDNGDYRTLVQDSVYDLRVGNRVRVVDGRSLS